MAEVINYKDFAGYVFDFDDTMLNCFTTTPGKGLHERSRLEAIQLVGEEFKDEEIATMPPEINAVAFLNSHVHTSEGAIWWSLKQIGKINGNEFDPNNPLLRRIVELKDIIHLRLLAEEAEEVNGTGKFIRKLAVRGYAGKLAIASTAPIREINVSLIKFKLNRYFLPDKIISKEQVNNPKPHPEAFLLAHKSLELDRSEERPVLAFEDDPRGISSAKNAGMVVCALTTKFEAEQFLDHKETPDIVVTDFNEVDKLLIND